MKRILYTMYFRRSKTVKYFMAAFLGAAIYAEWFVYLIQPLYWQQHDCLENDSTCTKILFIADPQIQGDVAVSPPLNYIFNWDSDRYLRSTFSVVMKHFKPDVLVFLGDLMDEGSIATMPEFHNYVKRLANIFDVDHEIVQVWIPGDNDIGGEHEQVYSKKVEEFEKTFHQPAIIRFRNISFYKVNVITNTYPQNPDYDNTYKIVVSHYPVLVRSLISSNLEKTFHPNIYFCAHEHESKYMTKNMDTNTKNMTEYYGTKAVVNFQFNEGLQHEVYVPTCSYRMGTTRIGYGAAVLDNDNSNLRYTVFWSSSRFSYLILYLVLVIILLVYCLIYYFGRLCNQNSKKNKFALLTPLTPKV